MTPSDLFAKYDVPVPRYTSYPTVPQWHRHADARRVDARRSTAAVADARRVAGGLRAHAVLRVAVHVLRLQHGDHARPRTRGSVRRPRARRARRVPRARAGARRAARPPAAPRRRHADVPLAGGARPAHRRACSRGCPRGPTPFEGSVEVDPRVTTAAHLEALRGARVHARLARRPGRRSRTCSNWSIGVQPLEALTADLCARRARARLRLGQLRSDLRPARPDAGVDAIASCATVLDLAPDRLAVYSFARVPWIKPAQRRFRDDQIPAGAEKRALYERVRDAAARRPATSRSASITSRCRPTRWRARPPPATLHRNFMGYTDVRTDGAARPGRERDLRDAGLLSPEREGARRSTSGACRAARFPTLRGHLLSADDQRRRDEDRRADDAVRRAARSPRCR